MVRTEKEPAEDASVSTPKVDRHLKKTELPDDEARGRGKAAPAEAYEALREA